MTLGRPFGNCPKFITSDDETRSPLAGPSQDHLRSRGRCAAVADEDSPAPAFVERMALLGVRKPESRSSRAARTQRPQLQAKRAGGFVREQGGPVSQPQVLVSDVHRALGVVLSRAAALLPLKTLG